MNTSGGIVIDNCSYCGDKTVVSERNGKKLCVDCAKIVRPSRYEQSAEHENFVAPSAAKLMNLTSSMMAAIAAFCVVFLSR